MSRRQDPDFMEADSDSDISILGERSPAKQKGKGKLSSKSDKGKGKQKDIVSAGKKQKNHHYYSTTSHTTLQQAYTWEASYTRSWDAVQEDEAGSLQGAVEELMARGRRRR